MDKTAIEQAIITESRHVARSCYLCGGLGEYHKGHGASRQRVPCSICGKLREHLAALDDSVKTEELNEVVPSS